MQAFLDTQVADNLLYESMGLLHEYGTTKKAYIKLMHALCVYCTIGKLLECAMR